MKMTISECKRIGLCSESISLLGVVKKTLKKGYALVSRNDFAYFRAVVNEFRLTMVIEIENEHNKYRYINGLRTVYEWIS